MMDIRIYQINMDRDQNNICFIGLDRLAKHQKTSDVDSSIYDHVYSGSVNAETLEDVFRTFNLARPAEYAARSLSVSDVVEVVSGTGNVKPGFYFCDNIGFQEIAFDLNKAVHSDMIKVVLLEPEKTARQAELPSDLKSLQHLVGGYLEAVYPFEDEDAVLLCNEEGKLKGFPLNRALRDAEKTVDMEYAEMRDLFRAIERSGQDMHAKGYIVFSQDSFDQEYSLESRTYVISSDNKAFRPNMGGYSIFGCNLDCTDPAARLDKLMYNEHGGKDGWKIERCYMKQPGRVLDILAGNACICGQKDGEFISLTNDQIQKYLEQFRYPEHFYRLGRTIQAEPYNPKAKTAALKDLVSDADAKRAQTPPGKPAKDLDSIDR